MSREQEETEQKNGNLLDILFWWDILRGGGSAAVAGPPDKFIQLRLLWRMRDPFRKGEGHAFLFAEQGNPVRNRNTTGELIKLSIRAVSMERSFFCESRSLIGKGPVGKAKRARGWNTSEHMSQKTYKKKDSRQVGGSFRCLLKMRRVSAGVFVVNRSGCRSASAFYFLRKEGGPWNIGTPFLAVIRPSIFYTLPWCWCSPWSFSIR